MIKADKHLHKTRYLVLAGPALAVMVGYGITRLIALRRRWRLLLLIILLGLQITGINWGFTDPRRRVAEDWKRPLASFIKPSPSASHVVVMVGATRGHAGSLIYELDPQVMIITANSNRNLEKIESSIKGYDNIWVIAPHKDNLDNQREFISIMDNLLKRLDNSGYHKDTFHRSSVIRLQKS